VRLVSFLLDDAARYGVHEGPEGAGVLRDVTDRLPEPDLARVLAAPDGLGRLADAAATAPHVDPRAVTWLPPVVAPAKILCIGVNYHAHREEMGRGDDAPHPTVFVRWPSSLVGHGQPVVRPLESEAFDYEGELAVVIGRRGRRIAVADALDHVAGYSCFLDGSVRDWQRHTTQFTAGKNFDRSGAFGPWIVTADEVPDPGVLHLRTTVDGEVLQDSGTDLLIASVPELIAYCSTFATLEPGDVIATGTPGGVGSARTPPRWLRPGESVEVTISGIGTLANPVRDETA
jgi:2-keto-4-pentenoate hydratase/2-oxohepta-3-ene-1,7-dioic acid hydratase in catechol pathway